MSGDRISAEREEHLRKNARGIEYEIWLEVDAVRADLEQARKERHAIFEASRELAAQCNAAEAALAAAREALERIATCNYKWRKDGQYVVEAQEIARDALAGGGGDPA